MKRTITERDYYHHQNITMANCLLYLSTGDNHHQFDHFSSSTSPISSNSSSPTTRVFECKTCNRQFPSFQALGGHRASHKKPRLAAGETSSDSQGSPTKPKSHECTICGLEFAIGQALGGHMRRHRAALMDNQAPVANNNINRLKDQVVKKTNNNGNSRRSVLCLDLNLTPLENDMKILQLVL
ncbi:hypothetical protein UlMin_025709 [Ulmus minor]